MANFPTSLDSLTNPAAGDVLTSPSHSAQHATANDILEALEAKVGIGASTPVAGRVFGSTVTGSSAWAAVPLVDGIKFPATQVPSADANTFDDYEEGIFTPGVSFATPGDLARTYTRQQGYYRKYGDAVHVVIDIITATFTHTTASGNFQVTGLPFTTANITGPGWASCAVAGWTKANYTQTTLFATQNLTVANILLTGSGQAVAVMAVADVPTGGNIRVALGGWYLAA